MANPGVDKLFNQIRSDMKGLMQRAPMAIGRIAINFMEENFEKGGYQDREGGGITKWEPRKFNDGSGRGVLIGKQSGRLMKSGTIFKADQKSVIVGVPDDIAEYGKIHNEGGTTHPKVTDEMRKFAWFKYYQETGKGKKNGAKVKKVSGGKKAEESERAKFWKGLALTKKKVLNVVLPKRQFLGNSPELGRRVKVFYITLFKQSLRNNTTFK
jgi:phage gpG-like protein